MYNIIVLYINACIRSVCVIRAEEAASR